MKSGEISASARGRVMNALLQVKPGEVLPARKAGRELLRFEVNGQTGQAQSWASGLYPENGVCVFRQAQAELLAEGFEPALALFSVQMPDNLPESWLTGCADRVGKAARQEGVRMGAGPMLFLPGLTDPVVIITMTGCRPGEEDGGKDPGHAGAGQDIIMTGFAGLWGSAGLTFRYYAALLEHFNPDFLADLHRPGPDAFRPDLAVRTLRNAGAESIFAAGQGGIYTALWDFGVRDGLGLTVDLAKIPVRQDCVEVCDHLGVNIYQLMSQGCVLAAADHSSLLLHFLQEAGIPAAVIGNFTGGNDRVILTDGEQKFLEPFRGDSFADAAAGVP